MVRHHAGEDAGSRTADPIAAAPILNDVQFDGGAERAAQKLREARRKNPQVQLWPEVSMTEIGEAFFNDGRAKQGVEVMKLNLLAYPDSADVEDNLADAYLADGQKDLARQHAEKALAILDAHKRPASSWTDTDEYRGEIRRDAEKILKRLTTGS